MTPCPAVAPAPTGSLPMPGQRHIVLPPLLAPASAKERRTLH